MAPLLPPTKRKLPRLAEPAGSSPARRFVRENYTKYEYRIPMRDGVKLFTSVYIPKDVFSEGRTYPMMMQRTPYNVAPYGADLYRATLGPSELFAREKFIFVYQDARGRFMSEGEYIPVRPHNPAKRGPKDIDESTDTYDAIDWLVKHVPGNTGKIGMYGISQPGFFATAGMIDAHPALVAVAPQAPVTDYYMGDDVYHNGAFMLAHRFNFYMGFRAREGGPAPPQPNAPFQFGTPDGYDFYLQMGSLANADEKYFKHKQPFWNMNIDHTTYDEVWQSRAIWKHLKNIKPAVMLVGGWYDTEDPQGLLRQHDFMERNNPPAVDEGDGSWVTAVSRATGSWATSHSLRTGVYYRDQTAFFPLLPEGPRRRGLPQGVCLSDRDESVAQVRPLAACRRQAHHDLSRCQRGARVAAARAGRVRRIPFRPKQARPVHRCCRNARAQ